MKRIFSFFFACLLSSAMYSQGVFTVVYATSDDGFVNVRERPTMKAGVVEKVWMFNHGLGNGVLRQRGDKWWKVSVGKTTGWAYAKFLGTMTWLKGNGSKRLIAAREHTNIYREDYRDGSKTQWFASVKKGTIIADDFEVEYDYYVLKTAHDNLYIKKTDAIVR